jgi:hypothetical protein
MTAREFKYRDFWLKEINKESKNILPKLMYHLYSQAFGDGILSSMFKVFC